MARYIDLDFEQDEDGYFDLVIDEDARDFQTTEGLESAIVISVFSDRRAAPDEVADPLKRRGWIGNMVAEVAGDNHGSGLWLYQQKRLTADIAAGLRSEAEQCLEWMIDEGIARGVEARVVAVPSKRQVLLGISLTNNSGDPTSRAYRLADATRAGLVAAIGRDPPQRASERDPQTLEWDGEALQWALGQSLTWE